MDASDWIALAGVVGTWVLAAAALWGERIKFWFPFLRPKLTIEPVGLGQIVQQNPTGLNARYYHLRVRNLRPRQFPAHEAVVFITLVEIPDADGRPTKVGGFDETVPITWVRQEHYGPIISRTIGPEQTANLLWVREDGRFQFEPVPPPPNHFPRPTRSGRADFWVTVQVRSVEADSKPRRFRVAWDGQWHDGATEIAKHLVVTPDPPST
jgi:hypothetical protein